MRLGEIICDTLQKISIAANIPLNNLLSMIDGEQVINLNFVAKNNETD